MRSLHHATYEEHDCQHDSHLYGNRKVHNDREEECDEKDCNVGLVSTKQIFECPPLTHVICNLYEDSRKA